MNTAVLWAAVFVNMFFTLYLLRSFRRLAGSPTDRREIAGASLLRPSSPPFEVVSLAGAKIRESDLRGQITALLFMSELCTPCKESTPTVYEMAKQPQYHRVQFLLIVDAVSDSLEEHFGDGSSNVTVCYSGEGVNSPFKSFGVKSTPTFQVIDGQGRLGANGPLPTLKSTLAKLL